MRSVSQGTDLPHNEFKVDLSNQALSLQKTADKTPDQESLPPRAFGSPIRSKFIEKIEEGATPFFNNPDN
jgi:hypothetical protein